MGKLVVVVLIGLIGFGVYWFYWEEDGANAPVTVEYEISGKGVEFDPRTRKMVESEMQGHVNIYATPDKARVDFSIEGSQGKAGKMSMAFGAILRLDKKKLYLMYPEKEIYAVLPLKFVKVKKNGDDNDEEIDWDEILKATVDGEWIGEEGEKYFARKYVPPKLPPGFTFGLWFTDQTKLGKRYTKGINKLLRSEPDPDEEDDPVADFFGAFMGKSKTAEERPQLKHPDYPFFPLPAKVEIRIRDQKTRGSGNFTIQGQNFQPRQDQEVQIPSGQGLREARPR